MRVIRKRLQCAYATEHRTYARLHSEHQNNQRTAPKRFYIRKHTQRIAVTLNCEFSSSLNIALDSSSLRSIRTFINSTFYALKKCFGFYRKIFWKIVWKRINRFWGNSSHFLWSTSQSKELFNNL